MKILIISIFALYCIGCGASKASRPAEIAQPEPTSSVANRETVSIEALAAKIEHLERLIEHTRYEKQQDEANARAYDICQRECTKLAPEQDHNVEYNEEAWRPSKECYKKCEKIKPALYSGGC